MNEILIEVRTVYGVPMIYPVNEPAKLLAEIAGTKTLTHKSLALAERMGFAIKEATPARTRYGQLITGEQHDRQTLQSNDPRR